MTKEITLDQLSEAVRKGLDHILDNVEVKAVITVKDKDGNVKRKMTTQEVDFNATRNNS